MKAESLMMPGDLQAALNARLAGWVQERVAERIWQHDGTVWVADPAAAEQTPELCDRLGWLDIAGLMEPRIAELTAFADEVRQDGLNRVVLLGMGGSSLAPEVMMKILATDSGLPLDVLDSTHPDQIAALQARLDLGRTLFVVSSKSGGTLETRSLFHHFFEQVGRQVDKPGSRFVAITDPGSDLERQARERDFRRVFLAPPQVGGRYSALTYFGLVPAALIGVDLEALLVSARSMEQAGQAVATDNPGLVLGALMGEAALAGRNKLSLQLSPALAPFGAWLEQLIAESTGKAGHGIVPVLDEDPHLAPDHDNDRLYVQIVLAGEAAATPEELARKLAKAGHPLLRIELTDVCQLGGEFFRWELATAAAGAVLGINPFDQPDVELAKIGARELMTAFERDGQLPVTEPALRDGAIDLFGQVTGGDASSALNALLEDSGYGCYVALLAYLPQTPEFAAALERLRDRISQRLIAPITVGFGPRYLHSTGQLHKGDANQGRFILITHDPAGELSIPGAAYGFETLIAAQAQGDFQALTSKGRRVLHLHFHGDPITALEQLG